MIHIISKLSKILIALSIIVLVLIAVQLYVIADKVDIILWTDEIIFHRNFNLLGAIIAICATVLLIIHEIWSKKAILVTAVVLLLVSVIVLVTSTLTIPDWNNIYREQQERYAVPAQEQNISEISWVDVLEKLRNERYYMLYVGRDNCDSCSSFKPMLGEVAYANDIIVLYYNTIDDREKKDFDQKTKTLHVEQVPTLKIIGHNGVISIGDDSIFSDKQALVKCLSDARTKYNLTMD